MPVDFFMQVIEFLKLSYEKTGWNYFDSVKLYREMGKYISTFQISNEIDLLISSGKIKKREGINNYIIELII